ncbi:MAG: hypothetical protein NZM06_02020 [Chloroherpetonaceae bacterium]|nr:hypothetical protein [Chloroherpetonaceae bacterium]MDW8438452.1 hypothetical protein [Chloroherpetonaceae bacterium]
MPKLFSSASKKFLKQASKPESALNKFICEHWSSLFPHLTFVASEFSLKGHVRSVGSSGRLDILAYNPASKRFVIFELKRDYDRNIAEQVADYRDYIEENFADVYLRSLQQYGIPLPKFQEMDFKQVEVVIVAKKFSPTHLEKIKKNKEQNVTLIKYFWFEDDFIFIDYLNNDPDEEKIESVDSKKVRLVKEIVNQDPDLYEIDRFFNLKQAGKEAFLIFYNWLKSLGEVRIEPKQVLLKVYFQNQTFSAIGYAGKVASKQILQINTNIDLTGVAGLLVEDRVRSDGRKKGSLASERYEVRIRNKEEMRIMIDALKAKL